MKNSTISNNYINIISELNKCKNKNNNIKFFKTNKGQYAENDKFLKIRMEDIRTIAKKYINISLNNIDLLLKNEYHEVRLTGIIILTYKFKKYKKENKKKELKNIFDYYLQNTIYINNWDLVDYSCYKIVGEYLINKNRNILYRLAKSNNMWERKIAIVSTFAFIKNNEYKDTLEICKILLNDNEDLIQKSAGWMLREIGKRIDKNILIKFLNENYKNMPRVMLRYAIERLSLEEKNDYINT